MALVLNGSVGKGRAQNMPVDVQAVQAILIARCTGDSGITAKAPSGYTCDQETINAIIAYQRAVLKLPFPDGVIVPGGTTHNMLNNPQLTYPGVVKKPSTIPTIKPKTTDAPRVVDPVLQGARQEAGTSLQSDIAAFESWYRDGNGEKILKGVPGFFARIEDGRRLYILWNALKAIPLARDNMGLILSQLGRLNAGQVDMMAKAMTKASGFTRLLGRAAGRAELLGLVTLGVDIYLHGSRGNWGAAAGEMYKTIMNKAVPWAGMIEGLQSLLDALPFLDQQKKTWMFRVLRALDPVGLGGAAPDALASLAGFILSKNEAEGYRILNDAVTRLKGGPTAIFSYPAEAVADKIFDWLHPGTYKGG